MKKHARAVMAIAMAVGLAGTCSAAAGAGGLAVLDELRQEGCRRDADGGRVREAIDVNEIQVKGHLECVRRAGLLFEVGQSGGDLAPAGRLDFNHPLVAVFAGAGARSGCLADLARPREHRHLPVLSQVFRNQGFVQSFHGGKINFPSVRRKTSLRDVVKWS